MRLGIKKEIRFEYAHRLFNYPDKCKHVHGHNQRVDFYFRRTDGLVDNQGFVIDFGDVKKGIGKWIDENWDHSTLLYEEDKKYIEALEKLNSKVYILPYNPTAENMAIYLLTVICPSIYKNSNVEVYKIEVYENDFSSAIIKLGD